MEVYQVIGVTPYIIQVIKDRFSIVVLWFLHFKNPLPGWVATATGHNQSQSQGLGEGSLWDSRCPACRVWISTWDAQPG